MSDPDLICCVDMDSGEALLPLSEYAPLIERNTKLEAALADALAQVENLANSLRTMLTLR